MVTVAVFVFRSARAFTTPGRRRRAFWTVRGHNRQCIPGTENVTVSREPEEAAHPERLPDRTKIIADNRTNNHPEI